MSDINLELSSIKVPEAAVCRICFESNSPSDLIAPCSCNGSGAWVHRQCLDKWRLSATPGAEWQCPTCKTNYEYEPEPVEMFTDDEKQQLLSTYRWRMFRDISIVVGVVITGFLLLTGLLLGCDQSNQYRLAESVRHWNPSTSNFGAYTLVSFLICLGFGSVIGGFFLCTKNDWDRHECCDSPRHSGRQSGGGGGGGDIWFVNSCNCGNVGGGSGGGVRTNGSDGDSAKSFCIVVVAILVIFGIFICLTAFITWVVERSYKHSDEIWKQTRSQLRTVKSKMTLITPSAPPLVSAVGEP